MNEMERKLRELEQREGKNYVVCRLGYNRDNGRFGILHSDLWQNESLHCGNEVIYWNREKEDWVFSRIEMDEKDRWYIVGSPEEHGDLEYLKVLYLESKLK